MSVCGRWNWPAASWLASPYDLNHHNNTVLCCLLDYTPARTGAAIYFGTSLDLLVMMSIVALHLFFSKAGPRRGRLLHPSLSASRCGDLAMAPPDLFWAGVPASGGAGVYYHFNFPHLRSSTWGRYRSRVRWLAGSGRPTSITITVMAVIIARVTATACVLRILKPLQDLSSHLMFRTPQV